MIVEEKQDLPKCVDGWNKYRTVILAAKIGYHFGTAGDAVETLF